MARYQNLKDYLKLNSLDVISRGIKDRVKSSGDAEFRIKDLRILTQSGIAFMPFDIVTFSLGVSCEVFYADKNSGGIYYYNVMLTGDMAERFSDLQVLAVEECTQETLISETVISMFGLPNITVDTLEEEADKIHSRLYAFVKKNEEHKYWFIPVKIKEKYKISDNMHMWPADLDHDVLGQIRFEESTATIYDIANPYMPYPNSPIPANTILLNVKYFRNELGCDDIITAAHELVHWEIHRDYMKLLQFLDDRYKVMECTSAPITLDDDMSPKEKARWYAEWQANELAIRVAIPKHLVEEAIDEYENSICPIHHVTNSSVPHDGHYYQNMVYKLSGDFNVPKEIMKKRLRQLGYDFVDGTILEYEENGKKTQPAPFYFQPGTLKENETFVIYRDNYERMLREDKVLAELIDSGKYIYLGYVVCLVDTKYIDILINEAGLHFQLTSYAREHADECCIKFTIKSVFDTGGKYINYDQTYLFKANKRLLEQYEAYIPNNLKKGINDFEKEDMYLNKMPTFGELLAYYLFEYKKDVLIQVKAPNGDFSYEANRIIDEYDDLFDLSVTMIKKYLNNDANPTLKTAMRICYKLDLNETQSRDMLKSAGYNLDAPTPENKVCRLIFRLKTKEEATIEVAIILDNWELCVEHFKEQKSESIYLSKPNLI
ncbi:ImmA/IrrE family metallo-endopeptidase [Ruminococcus flavefaciens]|uniref:IrrE N-terminal-like domain-containing protein n=1 Tax=Ruminococcus flavefaciens 007c TaxID=1341157 RepID=W7V287_RUMFL|nr:hypothetical protein [Ruminococcus flavefaciens]EWM55095.1 hypothetical protein RF007C_05330 [Ruminococcus flavefaciens 007c]